MLACAARCATALEDLANNGRIAVDDAWRILEEYGRRLAPSGQPGPGDAFYRWVLTNWANPDRCELVHLTENAARGFDEFPDEPNLLRFDPSDRKFVAVALAAQRPSHVVVALDRGWWNFRLALENSGVPIRFVCPDELRAIAER